MFRQEIRKAHKNENYITVQRFYMRLFDSFSEICALFKAIYFFIKIKLFIYLFEITNLLIFLDQSKSIWS